jgi:predicted O-methyltransferase YrrM
MTQVPLRRRLTDELKQPVTMNRLVRHGPLAFFQACMRLAFGVRPLAPWIPFDAAARLRQYLKSNRKATVMEYGSGMSTIWFAQHASHVVSVESNHAWAEKVSRLLVAKSLNDRVRLVQATDRDQYVRVADSISNGFDLLIIDGDHRLESGIYAMRLCRPGGVIYIDDSDKRGAVPEIQALVEAVQKHVQSAGGAWEFVTDFSPAQAFPKEGMIAWLPPRPSGLSENR